MAQLSGEALFMLGAVLHINCPFLAETESITWCQYLSTGKPHSVMKRSAYQVPETPCCQGLYSAGLTDYHWRQTALWHE